MDKRAMNYKLLKITLGSILVSCSYLASAQIYKCTDQKGQTQFSDKPCAPDAEVIEVDTSTSGINLGSQGDFSKVERDNKLTDSERKIARLQKDIEILRQQQKKETSKLFTERQKAIDNRLNAPYIATLTQDIERTSREYSDKIKSKTDEINALYKERRQLNK
jgi:TolA-binding protein